MATTSGGSIVLHPQHTVPVQTGQVTPNSAGQLTGMVQPLSLRTLQGIKVVPVPTQFHTPGNNQRVAPVIATHPVTSQNGSVQANQQFLARLISTRPGQIQGNQMIIPNSSYPQMILTPASQLAPNIPVTKQQMVNQVQLQPVNSFQAQVNTPQIPPANASKNNSQ